jgi:ethanolamine ammonia-lyase small subunit
LKSPVSADSWTSLRQLTPARIALGRTGPSLPTTALLEFGIAHAQARDAVHVPLDVEDLERCLAARAFVRSSGASLRVRSAVTSREEYLRRPDLGRQLERASAERLRRWAMAAPVSPRLVLVLADGLSAVAVARHAPPVLEALHPRLAGWQIAPLVIALEARVALGDEIGELMGAQQVAILIGERPGLSAPDSLGIYVTHAPRVGRTDAERNCISNIRPQGLRPEAAAERLLLLLEGAHRLGGSGVALKEDDDARIPALGTSATPT